MPDARVPYATCLSDSHDTTFHMLWSQKSNKKCCGIGSTSNSRLHKTPWWNRDEKASSRQEGASSYKIDMPKVASIVVVVVE